jgi:hypothetical protein
VTWESGLENSEKFGDQPAGILGGGSKKSLTCLDSQDAGYCSSISQKFIEFQVDYIVIVVADVGAFADLIQRLLQYQSRKSLQPWQK